MEEEFADFDSRHAWNSVYQGIRNESSIYSYTFKEAKKTENKNLNRYRDVNPFDHSRVCLQRIDRDYINASLVKVSSANRSYILTQGPLPHTAGHFWLMIWEQGSKAILMLNRIVEKNAVKCHQYWPVGAANSGDDDMVFSDVGLMVSYISTSEASNYLVREFLLTDFQSGQSRTVLQYHYITWPDFGVPDSPAAFLNFLMTVRQSGALKEDVGPAVVHCSAGIGRSGTFCLVDSCLVLVSKSGSTKGINIRKLLLDMRHYRMGLIQTPDQLRFSYLAIIEGCKDILTNQIIKNSVPSKNTKQVDFATNNHGNADENDVSDSESSDEGVVTSSNSTPPPLPPRLIAGSGSSFSESSQSVSGSLDTLPGTHPPSPVLSDQNQNEHCSVANHESPKSEESNPKIDNSVSADSARDSESAAELRKRKRQERSDKTAAIVQNIKKKQKESEQWQKRRLLFKRISVGLVLLFGTSFLVYKYYYKG